MPQKQCCNLHWMPPTVHCVQADTPETTDATKVVETPAEAPASEPAAPAVE